MARYEIWYNSGDLKAREFIKTMAPYAKRLAPHGYVSPHIVVRVCRHCDTNDANCLSFGSTIYCAPPNKRSKIPGRKSLTLGIEESCIYEAYNKEEEKWWNYMTLSYDCKDKDFSEECMTLAKGAAEIENSRIRDCITKGEDILQREYLRLQSSGLAFNPAIIINDVVYRVKLVCCMNQRRDHWIRQMCLSRFAARSTLLLRLAIAIMMRPHKLGKKLLLEWAQERL